MSNFKQFWIAMRNNPTVRHELPLEGAISLPMLSAGERGPLVSCFFYQVTRETPPQVHAPHAELCIAWPQGQTQRFSQSPEMAVFGHLPLRVALGPYQVTLSGREMVQQQAELLTHYDALAAQFPASMDTYPEEQRAQLADLFRRLTPDALHPYYAALSPRFYSWVMR